MAKFRFETAWAGLAVASVGLLAGIAVVSAVGIGLLMFGITRRVGS